MKRHLLYRGNFRDIMVVLSLISALYFPLNPWYLGIGLAGLLLGCLFRFLTKATLIRNEVLCVEGVYKIARHPYYLGNFIIDGSLVLLSGNVILVWLFPILFFWAYGPTFKKEEGYLSERYPQAYAEFLLRTPQVLPSSDSRVSLRELLAMTSGTRITQTEFGRIAMHFSNALAILLAHHLAIKGAPLAWSQLKNPWGISLAIGAVGLFALGCLLQLPHWTKKDNSE